MKSSTTRNSSRIIATALKPCASASKDYPLDKVADITWCDPEMIAHAARTYATSRPGCIVWGNGTDQLGNNTFQATRSLLILMGLTGNLDVPGGNVFYPAGKINYFELWDKLPPRAGQEAPGRRPLQGAQSDALCVRPSAVALPHHPHR